MFNKSFNAWREAFTLPFIKLLSIVFPKAPYAHAAVALPLSRATKEAKRPIGVLRMYHEHTPASVSAYNPYGLFVRVRDSLTEFIKGSWQSIKRNYFRSGQRESEYTVLKQLTSKFDKFNFPDGINCFKRMFKQSVLVGITVKHRHRVMTNGRNCGFADEIILRIYQTMEKDYTFKRYKTFLGKLAFRNGCTKSVFLLTFATIGKSKAKCSVDD